MAGAFDLNGEVKRLRDKGYTIPHTPNTYDYHTHLTHNILHIP